MKYITTKALVAVIAGTMIGSIISSLLHFGPLNLQAFYRFATNTIELFSFGSVFASIIMFIYAIPVYFILSCFGAVNWLTVILVGALPGMLSFFFWDSMLDFPILISGVAIAIVFYWLMRQNNATDQKTLYASSTPDSQTSGD